MLFFHYLKMLYHSQLHPHVIFPLFKDTLSLAIVSFSYYYYDPRITSAIRFYIYYFIFIILTSLLKILFLLFYFIIQECHRHSCCEMHIMQCMTYSSVHLCNPAGGYIKWEIDPCHWYNFVAHHLQRWKSSYIWYNLGFFLLKFILTDLNCLNYEWINTLNIRTY